MADVNLTNDGSGHSAADPTQPLDAEYSLGELFSRLTTDFSELVATQVDLAKVEIKEEVTEAGRGAGLLTGGGLAAYLGITFLSFAAAWGLDEVMPAALAFLLIALAWLVAAGLLYSAGRKQLRAVRVVPQTKAAIKEDVQWAKHQRS